MLNDTQCRTAKPQDKAYKLSDSHGLYLEVKPNGVKAWRYRFELRDGGKANCHDPCDSPWMMEDTGGVRASAGRGRSIL